MFNTLRLDHPLFLAIDFGVYLVVFVLLMMIFRLSLRLLAKTEADDSKLKALFTVLLILVSCVLAVSLPFAARAGVWMAIPILLLGTVFVNQLCWVPLARALIVVAVFMGSGVGLGKGLMGLANQHLPEGRKTLVQQINISTGLLEKFAGREGEAVFTKENLKNIKLGLSMNKEAWVSAMALLQNPEMLEEMVAEHNDDLRALGLIVDGETLTEEQLAELGIVYEPDDPALLGIDVLKGARKDVQVSEEDVKNVMSFLRSTRKDDSEVSPTDAVLAIREAIRISERPKKGGRKPGGSMAADAVLAMLESPLTVGLGTPGQEAPTTQDESTPSTAPPPPPPKVDPLMTLSPSERAMWRASRTDLKVTGVFHHADEGAAVVLNRKMVNLGDVVEIEKHEKVYLWRLVGATAYEGIWEPVLPEPVKEESAPSRRKWQSK